MKNIFTILLFGILVCSCSSNQSKAEDLIKDYMFKNLNDFESYESIETKVDSFYTSIYTDSFIVKRALNVIEFSNELDELRKLQQKLHESIMHNLKMIGYSDEAFYKYKADSKKEEEVWAAINEHKKIIPNEQEIIKVHAGKFVPTFGGWKATHRFRCKSAGGTYSIHNYMFYFDNDIKTITSCIDMDDNKQSEITNAINEALKDGGQ